MKLLFTLIGGFTLLNFVIQLVFGLVMGAIDGGFVTMALWVVPSLVTAIIVTLIRLCLNI